MKQTIISVLFVFSTISAFAQVENKISVGLIDSLDSKILNEKRKVLIHLPNGNTKKDADTSKKFAVIYLLDGDWHFESIAGMIMELFNTSTCPEMIVVGIPNTDRMRDLSPTHLDSSADLDVKTTGGGEKFISFLEKELIPYIDSNYSTAPYKILIGHSLGGLLVMQIFAHHTEVFNSYICIDPSMWWDNKKLLKEIKSSFANTNLKGKSLYLGIANTMDYGMNIDQVKKDTSKRNEHIRSILDLQNFFNKNKQNNLRYKSKYYENDTHNSSVFISVYEGLRFIYESYSLKLPYKYYKDTTSVLIDKIKEHYAELTKQMGYKINPDEGYINSIGYSFLQQKKYSSASLYFKLNIDNYPNSFNSYDSYGDYFVETGDKIKAIEYFKKALSIKENPESRRKLNDLLK
jgi:uncharacterized protein